MIPPHRAAIIAAVLLVADALLIFVAAATFGGIGIDVSGRLLPWGAAALVLALWLLQGGKKGLATVFAIGFAAASVAFWIWGFTVSSSDTHPVLWIVIAISVAVGLASIAARTESNGR